MLALRRGEAQLLARMGTSGLVPLLGPPCSGVCLSGSILLRRGRLPGSRLPPPTTPAARSPRLASGSCTRTPSLASCTKRTARARSCPPRARRPGPRACSATPRTSSRPSPPGAAQRTDATARARPKQAPRAPTAIIPPSRPHARLRARVPLLRPHRARGPPRRPRARPSRAWTRPSCPRARRA